MEMHEYLSELTGQIRSKKARQEVAREIQNNIEEQAKAYENEGRTNIYVSTGWEQETCTG